MKALLTGNAAIARGAFEAGVSFAAGYPGTPSTEILETIGRLYPQIEARWSPNEKVALEVGIGASLAGVRALVAMKHVGLNVAADPLFTFSYTGVNGGLLIVSADDPGLHSSQNEQDNRNYARSAKVPLLEPSDSMEAIEMTVYAFRLSEEFDTPVLLRTTTRINHTKTIVTLKERQDIACREYRRNTPKNVMIPAYGRLRHQFVEERMRRLQEASENTPLNRVEKGNSIGIITSGITYQYVREAVPDASVLKLGMPYPLPAALVREFAAGVEELYVVEELDPFLEDAVKALGLNPRGKELFPLTGEITPAMIAEKISGKKLFPGVALPGDYKEEEIPPRPPVLCPGCAHRGVFYTLKKLDLIVSGDIGCYTLGCLPPLESIDSCVCMGASIGIAVGMERANPLLKGRIVVVIGDSTFFHSGLTGLLEAIYNRSTITVIILDNRITAMTGHQEHPGTGKTLRGEKTVSVDPLAVAKGMGVKRLRVAEPLDLQSFTQVLKEELTAPELSVIVARHPCALHKPTAGQRYYVRIDKCSGCLLCLRLGCPALYVQEEEGKQKASIDKNLCGGCSLCSQVCRQGAIMEEVAE
ncbi:MAG: indolepyruvate ferredoxin oxidoreductase subunit alpha [Firmicutes bacterium]|nr:indolepyruvate ferredoxin oxidoreductase subunit alpha [Bacillota bacterium]